RDVRPRPVRPGAARDRPHAHGGACRSAARRIAAERPRSRAGAAGARLAGEAFAGRRARGDLGLDLRLAGATAPRPNFVRAMEQAHDLIRPWRRATIAVSAVAAVELVLLGVLAILLIGNPIARHF